MCTPASVCTCVMGRLFPAPAAGAQDPPQWTKPSSMPQFPKPRRNVKVRGFPRPPGFKSLSEWLLLH